LSAASNREEILYSRIFVFAVTGRGQDGRTTKDRVQGERPGPGPGSRWCRDTEQSWYGGASVVWVVCADKGWTYAAAKKRSRPSGPPNSTKNEATRHREAGDRGCEWDTCTQTLQSLEDLVDHVEAHAQYALLVIFCFSWY